MEVAVPYFRPSFRLHCYGHFAIGCSTRNPLPNKYFPLPPDYFFITFIGVKAPMDNCDLHTDSELVTLLQTGERAAFSAIYERYWKALYDIAYKRLTDKAQTEDVLQNVFARLWTRREAATIDNLGAYLSTAVRYEVIRSINRNRSALQFFQPFEETLQELEGPDARILARELLASVYAYADTLPEKRRRIFLLHIQDKLSTREIAETVGVSQKTVQNQLGTALQGLKTHLTPVIAVLIATRF
jgi:RNA polymerase sigma factor (sigma-70 family)